MQVSPPDAQSLDERIAQAEQRLVRREQRLRSGAARLKHSVHQRLRPRRWLPGAAVGAGLIALWSLARRRAEPGAGVHDAGAAVAPRCDVPSGPRLPLAQIASLAWPYAPAHWRKAVSPVMLSTAASVLSALASGILRRRSAAASRRPGPAGAPGR